MAVIVATIVLSGCAQKNVMDDYSGPVSRIASTYMRRGSHGGDYFSLSTVNGQNVTMRATTPSGNRRGDVFSSVSFVPSKPAVFSVVGATNYSPPIIQLANKIYRISGDISFTPADNKLYEVKGEMNDEHSAIWIEDSDSGVMVGNKIEIIGSTAVGLLEK